MSTPSGELDLPEKPEPMEKTILLRVRISTKAFDILSEMAQLFELDLNRYTKALLYREAGLYGERLDYRKREKTT